MSQPRHKVRSTPSEMNGFYDHMTCYRCGCFSDAGGIDLCPTHAAATEMLASLRMLLSSKMSGHVDGNEIKIHVDQAYLVVTRALLAKIEGREL